MHDTLLEEADAVYQLQSLEAQIEVAAGEICQSLCQSGKIVIAHCDKTKFCAQILSDGFNAQFNTHRPPLPNFILKTVSSEERKRDHAIAQYTSLICQPNDAFILLSCDEHAENFQKTLQVATRMQLATILIAPEIQALESRFCCLEMPNQRQAPAFISSWASLTHHLVSTCQQKMFDC